MDETRYSLREFHDSDFDAYATLFNAAYPEEASNSDAIRELFATFDRGWGPLPRHVVLHRGSGETVGIGGLLYPPGDNDPARPWIFGVVDPAHQHEGIGSYLYEIVRAQAVKRGSTGMRCFLRESKFAGRDFLLKRGFLERRRVWQSTLDVASANTSQLAPLAQGLLSEGIELTTLAQEGADDVAVLHRVHELGIGSGRDVPRLGTHHPEPFEQFRQSYVLEGPHALPNAWFLAKVRTQYVGESYAIREPERPRTLHQYYTGTLPEYRRRNIALALKLMVIDFAKRNEYAVILTDNDSLNSPMWTLNQRLGFRKVRETTVLEYEFGGTPKECNATDT